MGRAAAALILVLLVGCGGDGTERIGNPGLGGDQLGNNGRSVVVGGETPDGFDLPLPDDAQVTFSDEDTLWHFETALPPGEVPGFYEDQLPGYELTTTPGLSNEDAEWLVETMGGEIVFDGGSLVFTGSEDGSALLFELEP